MGTTSLKPAQALPVFVFFIILGFVDTVGGSSGYIKSGFQLTDKVSQIIPSIALIWVFFLSVPTGLLLGKYGNVIFFQYFC
jgi:MFS transporter, FHS family, L-fucose permease